MNIFGRWVELHIPEATCHPDKRWQSWRWEDCEGFPFVRKAGRRAVFSLPRRDSPDTAHLSQTKSFVSRGLWWMRSLSRCLALLLTHFFSAPLLFHGLVKRALEPLLSRDLQTDVRCGVRISWAAAFCDHHSMTAVLLLTSNSVICVLFHAKLQRSTLECSLRRFWRPKNFMFRVKENDRI